MRKKNTGIYSGPQSDSHRHRESGCNCHVDKEPPRTATVHLFRSDEEWDPGLAGKQLAKHYICHHPQDPCMVYLPTFTMKINQMLGHLRYMDRMGHRCFRNQAQTFNVWSIYLYVHPLKLHSLLHKVRPDHTNYLISSLRKKTRRS